MSPEDITNLPLETQLELQARKAAVDEAVIKASERTEAYKALPEMMQAMVSSGLVTLRDAHSAMGYGFRTRGGAKPPSEEVQEEIKLEADLKRLRKQAKRMGIKGAGKMGVTDLVEAVNGVGQ